MPVFDWIEIEKTRIALMQSLQEWEAGNPYLLDMETKSQLIAREEAAQEISRQLTSFSCQVETFVKCLRARIEL